MVTLKGIVAKTQADLKTLICIHDVGGGGGGGIVGNTTPSHKTTFSKTFPSHPHATQQDHTS